MGEEGVREILSGPLGLGEGFDLGDFTRDRTTARGVRTLK
jgi:hypothetical protein